MAMIGSDLATAVKTAIAAIPESDRNHDAVWNAIGDAIVLFLKTQAVVTVAGTATGVTAGVAAAPVTGTGTLS